MHEASSTLHSLSSPYLSSSLDNYSEEEYESFSSEQEASDDALQGQVSRPGNHWGEFQGQETSSWPVG